jgi:hypothetical protein
MMFAYDYPILGLFWTMMFFFLWFAWILLLFHVVVDIFRSDMKGISKGLWALFVIIVPWLGVLVYLIANGDSMAMRSNDDARRQQEQMDAYIRSAAGTGGTADELAKLGQLKDSGVITADEFESQKARLLT